MSKNTEVSFIREEKSLETWKLKRSRTLIMFICEAVVLGMEYSLTFITL